LVLDRLAGVIFALAHQSRAYLGIDDLGGVLVIEDVAFDDAATLAMGEAFDRTCKSLRIIGSTVPVREIIARRIIECAKDGEHDPARLYEQALITFGIVDVSMLVVSVGRDLPYASVTHAA
jgi:hypothetical protein